MKSFYFLSMIFFIFLSPLAAQVNPDSIPGPVTDSSIPTVAVPPKETVPFNPMADSFSMKPVSIDSAWAVSSAIPFSFQVMQRHPYFGFNADPVVYVPARREMEGKELLFYVLIGLLLAFAFLRQAFAKYFNDLFRLFFRTTLKYRQIREQLMQTPLPSLLLNGFFVISGGLYITFLLLHYQLVERENFWLYFFYSCLGLSAIYFVKFLGLKIIGWIFNMKDAADSYIFVVFVINKVIGVFLLPFIIMLAFMTGSGYSFALVLSWFGIGALLLYRFILSYAAVRNQVRFNPFHFFLYLCAFEIAPLLLIYKALLVFFQ